jgi:hypothetical protein
MVTMGSARDRANRDTSVLPRFRALPVGGKPLLPACFVLIGQYRLQCSSSYSGQRKKKKIGSPMLRVQAPLYRRGPGYRLGNDSAGCRLLGGGVLGVIPSPCSDSFAL